MAKRVVISWSGGKDSAWTLHTLRRQPDEYTVLGLLTTINQRFNRIAIHGVRRELLEAQAKAAKLPLWVVPLPSPCTNTDYECQMLHSLAGLRSLGIDAIAFGDLFLEDIRRYRETQFANCGLELLFPVWGLPTQSLAEQMIDAGLKAKIGCLNPKAVPPEWAGRDFDRNLLAELPPSVDPCAENGEFHTFVYAGPMFADAIAIKTGEIVEREGFVYADLEMAVGARRSAFGP